MKLPHHNPLGQWESIAIGGPDGGRTAAGAALPLQGGIWHTRTGEALMCPYGGPGTHIWVRETHDINRIGRETFRLGYVSHYAGVRYRADDGREQFDISEEIYTRLESKESVGWAPSIHMPRWACRIVLEITNVRVERLQDISEIDAIAEGVLQHDVRSGWVNECRLSDGKRHFSASAYEMYRKFWDDLNAKRGCGWDVNPWVWAITFKRVNL